MKLRSPAKLQRNHYFFLLTLAGLAAVLGLLYFDNRNRADTADELALIGQDTAVLHTATSIFEVNRFRESVLAAMGRRPGEPAGESVQMRFDILWNNVDTANSGALRKRFDRFDREDAIGETLRLLARHEAQVAAFDPADRAGNLAMLEEFLQANVRLRTLLTEAYRNERSLLHGVYDRLMAQRESGRYAGVGVAIVSLLVLGGALILNRRDRRLSRKLIAHARAAEEAAETRARFLTMVSHELRTPMNGVLGLLDVVRAIGLEDRQSALVGAASASAHEMLLVIEALLTLSDVRDGRCVLLDGDASLESVAAELRRRLAPLELGQDGVVDGGVGGGAVVRIGAPGRFRGDPGRLIQALAFILHYVRKTLGAQGAICTLSADAGALLIRVDLGGGAALPWALESILAEGAPRGEDMAADALGPLAGRMLLDLMGAGYALSPQEAGRSASVEIRIPEAGRAGAAASPASGAMAQPAPAMTFRAVGVTGPAV